MISGFQGSGKITLDKDTFKALASETRIGILKKLDKSQLTVSDLSRALDMSKATLFEHLEKLIKIGLIKKKEDNRKWVYYKLTLKGKNVLHPERTKIAIVLTIFISAFIILGIFYLVNSGYLDSDADNQAVDISLPSIQFLEVEDITENTKFAEEFLIDISSKNSIDKSSIKVEYTISNKFTHDYNQLTEWKDLTNTFDNKIITSELPSLNWSNNLEKYVYIRSSVSDVNGNSASEVYVEFIENIYEESTELSIVNSDIKILKNVKSIPKKGFFDLPIELTIHNTGGVDLSNIEISVYDERPFVNSSGIISMNTPPIETTYLEELVSGSTKDIQLNLKLNLSSSRSFWVVVDPNNMFNESNEQNNIVRVDLTQYVGSTAIPEFPPMLGVMLILVIIFVYSYSKKNRKQ
jgi:DNA-binding transcriptional ArsR family regulator